MTKLEDGQELAFTAEVDVRPEITLPDLESLKITVDPIEVTDEEVDAELQSLRARFGTLTGVERGAQEGTSSRSTCRPQSTAKRFPRPPPKACRTRSVPVS